MKFIFFLILMFPLGTFAATISRPYLYEVTGGAGKVYLFGTAHFGFHYRNLPPEMKTLLPKLQSITFEVDAWEKVHFFDIDYQLNDEVKFNRTQINAALSPSDFQQLIDLIKEAWYLSDVDHKYTDVLSPVAANLIIRNAWMVRNYFDKSLDTEMEDEAIKDKVSVFRLESPQDTYEAMAPYWHEAMKELQDYFQTGPKVFDDFVKLYASGDEQAMSESVDQYKSNYPKLGYATFDSRSLKWHDQLLALTKKSGNHMLAVGAGHLFGANGLIGQLRAAGFTVTRVAKSSGTPDPNPTLVNSLPVYTYRTWLSPDSQRMLMSVPESKTENFIETLDVKTGKIVKKVPIPDVFGEFSPDGKMYLNEAGGSPQTQMYDVETGDLISSVDVLKGKAIKARQGMPNFRWGMKAWNENRKHRIFVTDVFTGERVGEIDPDLGNNCDTGRCTRIESIWTSPAGEYVFGLVLDAYNEYQEILAYDCRTTCGKPDHIPLSHGGALSKLQYKFPKKDLMVMLSESDNFGAPAETVIGTYSWDAPKPRMPPKLLDYSDIPEYSYSAQNVAYVSHHIQPFGSYSTVSSTFGGNFKTDLNVGPVKPFDLSPFLMASYPERKSLEITTADGSMISSISVTQVPGLITSVEDFQLTPDDQYLVVTLEVKDRARKYVGSFVETYRMY